MNRRNLLKLLSLGVIGHTLDIDKLLWVPGKKTIFLPSTSGISASQIIALEMERTIPKLQMLFERDDTFFAEIARKKAPIISSRPMRIPLIVEPGRLDD